MSRKGWGFRARLMRGRETAKYLQWTGRNTSQSERRLKFRWKSTLWKDLSEIIALEFC